MKSKCLQAIILLAAVASVWALTIYGDLMDPLARVAFCIPIAFALCYQAWQQWMLSHLLGNSRMRALGRDLEQRNRISDLQHCFLDTLIAMDLGLERCGRLAEPANRPLHDELNYLQEGIRELKHNTLDTRGKDYWLSPLM